MKICFLLPFLLLAIAGTAQSSLQKSVEALVSDPALKHAGVSICVVDVESGTIVASYQADLSLTPASSLKVVTTATALALLGADFHFSTELGIDGSIEKDGTLRGNVYLIGSGDPTLGSDQLEGTPDLEAIVEKFRLALQQKGIRKVDGHIVGDGTRFSTAANAPTWQWNDLGNYYAAGAWGLNIHENFYYLRFAQIPTLGETPRIAAIEPEVPGLEFINEVTSAPRGSGDNAYIYGAPYTFTRHVRGTIPVGSGLFSIKGSIPDPPLWAAQLMLASIERIGIPVNRGAISQLDLQRRGWNPAGRTVLLTHLSPPLRAIIERTNQQSVNLYCESLLRALALKNGGEGSLEKGLEIVTAYWANQGLDTGGCYLQDGSGLSARNAVTTRFLASLLRSVARQPVLFEAFLPSLPAAGQSGALQNLRGAAAGRLWAKSGTLDRVRSFTGYARNREGRLRAFSVIVNNFTGAGSAMRQKLETFMTKMCE